MKRDLRRIEETLYQLNRKPAQAAGLVGAPAATGMLALPPSKPSFSFEVHPRPPKAAPAAVKSAVRLPSPTPPNSQPTVAPPPSTTTDHPVTVQPLVVEHFASKAPSLPKFKLPTFTSHRNAANPALAANLLRDMLTTVEGWQTELNQTLLQIQDLYLEGPIVDGWLESHAREPEATPAVLRHAETDRLMNYVEELCAGQDGNVICETPRTGYRLCGLNPDGQMWSCPCPPEQVPSLSLAIARYQKLRQLLARKHHLETRLNHLAETLVVMHGQLKD